MSAKMATLGLLKIKLFWNKGFDLIISVYDVTNKILLRDSNYIVDVVMWPKFGNPSISVREVIITSLGIALRFYTSMAKRSKLKVTKFWGLVLRL